MKLLDAAKFILVSESLEAVKPCRVDAAKFILVNESLEAVKPCKVELMDAVKFILVSV